jgi:hypothetical protein
MCLKVPSMTSLSLWCEKFKCVLRRVDSAQLDTVLLAEVPSFPFLQRLGQCVCGAETAVRWLARATATAARDRETEMISSELTPLLPPFQPVRV